MSSSYSNSSLGGLGINTMVPSLSDPNLTSNYQYVAPNAPSLQYLTMVQKAPENKALNKEWIDLYLLKNYQYGGRIVSEELGITDISLIPSYLINFNPPDTQPNSNGVLLRENITIDNTPGWNEYLKVQNKKVYIYVKSKSTGEEKEGASWDIGIPDTSIVSLDGSKIFNYQTLFEKATANSNLYIDEYGQSVDGYSTLPTIIHNGKLYAVGDKNNGKESIIKSLATPKGQLWIYDKNTDKTSISVENIISDQPKNLFRKGQDNLLFASYKDSSTVSLSQDQDGLLSANLKNDISLSSDVIDYSNRFFSYKGIVTNDTVETYKTSSVTKSLSIGSTANIINSSNIFTFETPPLPEGYLWLAQVNPVLNNANNEFNVSIFTKAGVTITGSKVVGDLNSQGIGFCDFEIPVGGGSVNASGNLEGKTLQFLIKSGINTATLAVETKSPNGTDITTVVVPGAGIVGQNYRQYLSSNVQCTIILLGKVKADTI